MFKNIVINNQLYQLPLTHAIKGETSGICYHLKNENVDWAVKLYYKNEEKIYQIYPTLLELQKICSIQKQVVPVMVSEYPVFDEFNQYIGCCSPFIDETRGKTCEILYKESVDLILEGLYKIQETLSIFTKNYIEVSDWSLSNMKFGSVKNLDFGMYLYDDSFYGLSDVPKWHLAERNAAELNHLIYTIISDYYDYHNKKEDAFLLSEEELGYRDAFCNRFNYWERSESSLVLLEKESHKFPNLEAYLEDAREKQYCL